MVEKKTDVCSVFFVDYGNTEDVEVKNIRRISQDLVGIPAMALICQLDGKLLSKKSILCLMGKLQVWAIFPKRSWRN